MAEVVSHGACLCGDITFTLNGHPSKVLACYCIDCQKNAGGPYQVLAAFQSVDVQTQDPRGHTKVFTITHGTQSGFPKEKHFCGNCGCTLWTLPMKYEGRTRMVRTSLVENGLSKFPVEKEIFKAA